MYACTYVHVCVCVCVCVYPCVRMWIHACMYMVHVFMRMCACAFTGTSMYHVCVHMCVICVHMHIAYKYTCICMCTCVCVCVCVRACVSILKEVSAIRNGRTNAAQLRDCAMRTLLLCRCSLAFCICCGTFNGTVVQRQGREGHLAFIFPSHSRANCAHHCDLKRSETRCKIVSRYECKCSVATSSR